MTNFSENPTLRKAALVSGVALLFMTILAIGTIFVIFEKLIIPGDVGATVNNLFAGETQFRIGIVGLFMVAILDVLVAWSLYIFLEPTNKNLSLLAAWFRLVYAVILGVALSSYTNVLQLLSGESYIKGMDTSQLHTDVMLSIKGFDDRWAIALVFFGVHLVILGYLAFKSSYVPSILGIVLAIAGVAYVTDSFGRFLLPSHVIELAAFMGWGELLFMLWLLYKGLRAHNT